MFDLFLFDALYLMLQEEIVPIGWLPGVICWCGFDVEKLESIIFYDNSSAYIGPCFFNIYCMGY
jgi:hypothetical protein